MDNTPSTKAQAIVGTADQLEALISGAIAHPHGQALREALPAIGAAVAELRAEVAKLRGLGELAELLESFEVDGELRGEFVKAGGELRGLFDGIGGAIAALTADVAQLKAEARRAPCEGCTRAAAEGV